MKDIFKAAIIWSVQQIFAVLARDITELAAIGPFIVIAPHPDDETLGCGSFVARARTLGQCVHLLIVTDGGASPTGMHVSKADLVKLRRDETKNAAEVLGVDSANIIFLEVPDGEATAHMAPIAAALRELIELVSPKIIFSSYGIDRHRDHRAVANALEDLYRNGNITCRVLEYPIWFWLNGGIALLFDPKRLRFLRRVQSRAFVKTKRRALQAHSSQFPHLMGRDFLQSFFRPASFAAQYLGRCEIFIEKA
jgi:LmbE family N-acetylglucosaminyl deacetylase